MLSVWSGESGFEKFPQLKNDIKTSVAVIGGGITGLLCAYMLKQNGVN